MIQIDRPLPDCVPGCLDGHHPRLVETRGRPVGLSLGGPCPSQWHIECHACGCASVPSTSRAIAELRWCDPAQRIPLSQLPQARARASLLSAA